jgi:hypothetical protein
MILNSNEIKNKMECDIYRKISVIEMELEIKKQSIYNEIDNFQDSKHTNLNRMEKNMLQISKKELKWPTNISIKLRQQLEYLSIFSKSFQTFKKLMFGKLYLIDHKRIKENDPKIIQFRTSMEKCRGFCEINNGKIAVYGENNQKGQNVINILSQRYQSINVISEIRQISKNSVEKFSDLVKLCSDTFENIFILLKNRILVCDIDLRNCQRVIQLENSFIPKDIFYFKKCLYVLNKNDIVLLGVYNVDDYENSLKTLKLVVEYPLELFSENANDIEEPNSILVTEDVLIVHAVDKNIYIYKYGVNDVNSTLDLIQKIAVDSETKIV